MHIFNLVRLRSRTPVAAALVAVMAVGFGIFFVLTAQGQQDEPDLNVTVSRFVPQSLIDPHTNITIYFSRDMMKSDSLDWPILFPPVEFDPPISGIARWIETDVLRFYPDHGLAPATRYAARVKSGETYRYGNMINDPRIFEFHTPALGVNDVSWRSIFDPRVAETVRLAIDIRFKYNVDLDQLADKIEIIGKSNAAQSRLAFEITNTGTSTDDLIFTGPGKRHFSASVTLTTESFSITNKRQTYYLKIKSGLTCDGCGEGLADNYSAEMAVQAYRRQFVRTVSPRMAGKTAYIQINCNAPVDPDIAREYITISPEIDYTIEKEYYWLTLHGPFKSGQTFTVMIAKGMPAEDGGLLDKEFSTRVKIPDIPPAVTFSSEGIYLPKGGAGLLEVETVNLSTLAVEIDRIFANNLVYALSPSTGDVRSSYFRNMNILGKRFFHKKLDLNSDLNEPLATTIDVGGIVGDSLRGIYKVAALNWENRWVYDSRLVMLTDIGILARLSENYLMVWANSLSESKPIKNAEVKLFSTNNQELLTGRTDSRGVAVFNNIAGTLEGFKPFVITVERDDDLSFLNLSNCRLPTSDFNIKGRPYHEGKYEAFLYLDRGVYRPGDTVRAVSLVREADGSPPPDFPYLMMVKDPTGKEFKSYRVTTDTEEAATVLDIVIPNFAQTGKYTLIARIGEDYEIGRTTFQVEEFMPDRIKTTVTAEEDEYRTGDTVFVDVLGQFLFGPPAINHKVMGHVTIEPYEFQPGAWSSYTFIDKERSFSRVEVDLPDQMLDENGAFTYTHIIPTTYRPPSALKGLFSAGVSEQGGRAVFNYDEVVIHPYPRYVGLRFEFEGYVKPGQPCEISLVGIDADGETSAVDNVSVTMYRIIYNSVLQRDSRGYYRYRSEKKLRPVDSANVDITPAGTTVSFVPQNYGNYLIKAEDSQGGHATSQSFYASGWGYAPWSMEHPDRIEIDLDRGTYSPGEQAHVQIRAPFGGMLLLTIEKDQVYEFITLEMEDNTADIRLPVKKDYFPNAYITATVIKKAGDIGKASPARAFGMAPLVLSTDERRLPVTLAAPDVIKPRSEVNVNVSIGKPGITHLTLAAVDAGILQLTDYTTPNPLTFFYGKKQPLLIPYDIYSFIFPEIERARSHLSPAGGRSSMFETARKRHLSPVTARRVKPVALWSGLVTTDAEGNAVVPLSVPEFNGKLVLVAVAFQEELFGTAARDMIVRDNIVIQESFPRFVTPNDVVDGFVTLFNNTDADADIIVRLETDGPVELISPAEQTVSIENNAESKVVFTFRARTKPGKISCKIIAAVGSERAEVNFELPNRPGQPLLTKFGFGSLTEEKPASYTLPAEWMESTTQTVLQTSSLAAVTCTRHINYLVRYPYGCLEQTTSGLFPLLYFNDLARFVEPEVFGTEGPDYFIQEGILKLSGKVRPDGWFNFWPGVNYYNSWTTIYASHFLLEAKENGFHVDKGLHKLVVKTLKDIARGKKPKNKQLGYPEQIYAAYALTRGGIVENRIINEMREISVDALPAFSRYMLAGVYHAAGESDEAMALLPDSIVPAYFEPETGGRFSSGVRTNAILLSVLTDIDPNHPGCPVLVKSLMDDAAGNRWYTTQATAWALMALGKFLAGQVTPDFGGVMNIVGDLSYNIDTSGTKIIRTDLIGNTVNLEIIGRGTCYYYWQTSGVPTTNAPEEFTRGIKVKRTYLNADGTPLDFDNVWLGEQIICHIEAEATDNELNNVVINDLLPGGLEIENPRLKTTPRLSWVPESSKEIVYQDIRDDRLLLFADLRPRKTTHFYYSLRVTSAGQFIVPPIAAECMYNPTIAGASSSGMITVNRSEGM